MEKSARTWSAGAAAALAAVLGGGAAAGAWMVREAPDVAWLSSGGPARWIVYPVPADTKARARAEMAALFRRSFRLGSAPRPAVLRVESFRLAEVRVNGRAAARSSDAAGWKAAGEVDVADLLRAGENQIEVVARNDLGPPALRLELRLPGGSLVSDHGWEASLVGAAWRPAALAADPPAGRRYDPSGVVPSPLRSLLLRWPTLLLLATLAAALVAGAAWMARRGGRRLADGSGSPWPWRVALGAAALAWAALFANNLPAVPLQVGFDAGQHLEYVRYILERRSLPLADEGWQMFQPPLYYLVSALALGALGLDVAAPGAALVFRAIGLGTGIANLVLVALILRRVFPGRPERQVVGILLAAALPCHLYMSQLPGNEVPAAALASAAQLVALDSLQRDDRLLRRHLLLGFLLGLALLAKFSTLLLLPAVLGALGLGALRARPPARGRRLLALAAAGTAALATCGWHFGRVWARFGDPLVGGWEARPGLGWWLDPGYRTAQHFLRFGRALSSPLFAGLDGFWDGLYSTLWGDGMLSGLASTAPVPPWWSASLQPAVYLLALVPTLAILVGAGWTAAAWVRRGSEVDGLMGSLALLVLVAQALMSLKVPSVAQDKASYGLMALAPLCFFGARGLGALAGSGRLRLGAALVAFGTWALASHAALWADPSSAGVRMTRALARQAAGDASGAHDLLRAGVAADPGDWETRVALARMLMEGPGPTPEVEALLAVGEPGPAIPSRHLAIALWAMARRDTSRAVTESRRAVALDLDDPEARALLAEALSSAGLREQAIEAWREVLRIEPQDFEAHAALASLYDRAGQRQAAAFHGSCARRFRQALRGLRSPPPP